MKIKNLTLVFALITVLSSCSTFKSFTNYDQNVDFSKYKHFLVMERLESEKIDDKAKKQIGSLIAEELQQRGMNQNLSPDIVVKVMIISKQKEAATITRNNDFYWGSDYYQYGWGIGTNVNKVSYNEYTDGTMVIDIIDREKKQLVWQGIANGAFKGSNEKKLSDIKKMINKIFVSYPLQKQ